MTEPSENRANGPQGDDRNPIETALDLAVFAPLGFALEYRRLLPELAEAGRRQLAFSRSLGRMALKTIAKASSSPDAKPQSRPRPEGKGEQAKPSATTVSNPGTNSSECGEVAGYDTLTAKEIRERCRSASEAQLAWMHEREAAGKQRKTVLAALSARLTSE